MDSKDAARSLEPMKGKNIIMIIHIYIYAMASEVLKLVAKLAL